MRLRCGLNPPCPPWARRVEAMHENNDAPAAFAHPCYSYLPFHGMQMRSINSNSTAVISPRMPTTTMPTNM